MDRRTRRETRELVNVLIDENEKVSREIIRIQKSEEFSEFLKRSKMRNEEDEKENEKQLGKNAMVYSQLTEAMQRNRKLTATNERRKAEKGKLVKEIEVAGDKMHSRIEQMCAQQCEQKRKLEKVSVLNANIVRENNGTTRDHLAIMKKENEQLTKTLLELSKEQTELRTKIEEIVAENEKMIAEMN